MTGAPQGVNRIWLIRRTEPPFFYRWRNGWLRGNGFFGIICELFSFKKKKE
jgi:hypothetical protein